MRCYVCGKSDEYMLLKRRDSKDGYYHGAVKCEVCAKNGMLKERFENYHTVKTYHEQITFKLVIESPDVDISESDKMNEVEGKRFYFCKFNFLFFSK